VDLVTNFPKSESKSKSSKMDLSPDSSMSGPLHNNRPLRLVQWRSQESELGDLMVTSQTRPEPLLALGVRMLGVVTLKFP